jgi:spore cortex biosynthesis protein YabQ
MVGGALFDFYRVLRGRMKTGVWLSGLGDLLFWFCAFVVAVPLIYWGTWLELRLYVWLVLLGGAVFYFLIISPALIPLYVRWWRAAVWLPRFLLALPWRGRLLLRRLVAFFRYRLRKP